VDAFHGDDDAKLFVAREVSAKTIFDRSADRKEIWRPIYREGCGPFPLPPDWSDPASGVGSLGTIRRSSNTSRKPLSLASATQASKVRNVPILREDPSASRRSQHQSPVGNCSNFHNGTVAKYPPSSDNHMFAKVLIHQTSFAVSTALSVFLFMVSNFHGRYSHAA